MDQTETETAAFAMTLNPGAAAAYKQRHDEIWPELAQALRDAGVIEYRIYLDPQTHRLFAAMTRRRDHGLEALSDSAVMRRWWAMMADLMQTHPDTSPVAEPLPTMFDLANR
jgi:L-rhamnose mutarotase